MPKLIAHRSLLLLAFASGCAQIGEPPGGPPDLVAPKLTGTFPESTAVVPGFDDDAEFQFDEIVNEGGTPNFGTGTGDLERLILLSPTNRVPNVSWKKRRIAVRPREGWQANRVYRIELLPGVADLRNNRSTNGRIITFSTGAPLPTRFLEGRVVDWSTSRPQALALVEAILQPDSLVYRTSADSSGRFRFGPLPDGEYLVGGVLDQNRNNRLDRREAFDTVRIAAGRDSVGELWAFQHDSVAARIQGLAVNDSLSIGVTFNQRLNPYQRFITDSFRVRLLPDSTLVPIDTVVLAPAYDSLFRRGTAPADSAAPADSVALARARADSVRQARADSMARADSIRRAQAPRRRLPGVPEPRPPEGPLTSRPALFDRIIIRLGQQLVPGARYVVETNGIENVSRVAGRAILGLAVPERKPPPDSTRAQPDSGAAPRPDSAAPARPDTTAPPRRDSLFFEASIRRPRFR
jgi:hypothetical protein